MKSLNCPPAPELPGPTQPRQLAQGCEWKKIFERVEGPHTISMDASARRYDVCLDGKDGINRAAGQALPAPSAKPSHPRFCAGASHKRSGVSQWQGKVLHASALIQKSTRAHRGMAPYTPCAWTGALDRSPRNDGPGSNLPRSAGVPDAPQMPGPTPAVVRCVEASLALNCSRVVAAARELS